MFKLEDIFLVDAWEYSIARWGESEVHVLKSFIFVSQLVSFSKE